MMKTIRYIFIGFLGILILFSCAPAYVPNVVNSPMFNNKGEIQASVHSGISGIDPQLAYSVTDHIGVMFNGSFRNFTDTSSDCDDFHKHQFYEFGLGYYDRIGESGRFETYGGYGFGNLSAKFDNGLWASSVDVRMNRYFIQPAIGISNAFFDGSFATRIAVVDLRQRDLRYTNVFFEPVITAKLGFKYVKWVFQMGCSFPVSPNKHLEFEYQPFIFSGGIQINLGRKYKNSRNSDKAPNPQASQY